MIAHRASRDFGWPDWVVLSVYIVMLLSIALRFARRQRTTEEYFMGGRRMNPLLAGVSLFASYFSVISYIAYPGEYVRYGPGYFISNLIALPLVFVAVGWVVIPIIMRLPITSAFELLEARLGRPVRQMGSFVYIFTRLIWMALILYTGSLVLVSVIGCDPRWRNLIAAATGAVTTIYTLLGGIRTVMITEAVQFFMLLTGALLTMLLISSALGGVGVWWPRHWEPHWQAQPVFSLDPHVRISLAGMFVSCLLGGVCLAVSDQASVQRLLTTRNASAARKAYLLRIIAVAVVSFALSLVGAALLAFYRIHPDAVPSHLTYSNGGDAFFPLYISHFLPSGVSGMVVASLLAAAMSCLAGGINSTVTVLTKDFIETSRSHGGRSEAAKMRLSRFLVLEIGATVILASIGMGAVRGNLNEVASKTTDLLICPTFGLFFLAMFVRYATPFGAIFGAFYSAAAAVLVGYWDVLTRRPGLSFLWITPVSFAVSVAGSCFFSLWPTRGRSAAAIIGYALAALLPLIAFTGWLIAAGRG